MRRGLFVVNNPVFGGGTGQLLRLQRPLAERGWELEAVTPDQGDAAERLRAGGITVHPIPLHRLRARPDPRLHAALLWRFGPEVEAIRGLIRRREISFVQAHGDIHPHAAVAARRERVALIWQLYDTRTPHALRRVTMPFVTRMADVVTTWGEQLGREYPGVAELGERWITVFPPVDGNQFAGGADVRERARAELGIGADDIAVALIGMRNPSKGHDHFVRALALARREAPGLIGRILGGASPAHADYERGFMEEARALGLLDGRALTVGDAGNRVPELLPAFDMLALSSVPRSEGMPTVILEAMACGLPVVATDVGAVGELVIDRKTGLVVAPEDDAALAEGLVQLAGDCALRGSLGAAGRRRFEAVFGLDRLVDRHVEAYELAVALAAERPPTRRTSSQA